MEVLRNLRLGNFDAVVGVNLLREGLDIPEVSLVVVLDADKEGFLRSETALIQNCGRAARNVNGRVILYADKITKAIKNTVDITTARRKMQMEYNILHGIVPKTVTRDRVENLRQTFGEELPVKGGTQKINEIVTQKDIDKSVKEYENKMKKAAKELRFEEAAHYRDLLQKMQHLQLLEEDL